MSAADPQPTRTLNLWPGQAPGETKPLPPEAYLEPKANQLAVKRLGNVSVPQIAVYEPAQPNGTAVVIAPGGGYTILAIEHEGTDVARWLNSLGVTAIVLKYRVPRRPMQSPENLAMLQDAQRAVGIVRARAKEWKIHPDRIGVMGFSAGGHLMASLSTDYATRRYDPVDAADAVSCRPDFAILLYTGGAIRRDTGELTPQIQITRQTPPMCLIHTSDDNVSSENSVAIYRALRANGVPAEMHLYATGGHGYGLDRGKGPVKDWPLRVAEWLVSRGLLPPQPGTPASERTESR